MTKQMQSVLLVVGVVALVAGVAYVKGKRSHSPADETSQAAATQPVTPGDESVAESRPTSRAVAARLPKLVDLGADKCIPCRQMAPILAGLKKEYEGRFEVVFIDIWKNPAAAEPYRINLIPTQIFFDADGKERFRHEGFFSKADILGTWKKLGVEIK